MELGEQIELPYLRVAINGTSYVEIYILNRLSPVYVSISSLNNILTMSLRET